MKISWGFATTFVPLIVAAYDVIVNLHQIHSPQNYYYYYYIHIRLYFCI